MSEALERVRLRQARLEILLDRALAAGRPLSEGDEVLVRLAADHMAGVDVNMPLGDRLRELGFDAMADHHCDNGTILPCRPGKGCDPISGLFGETGVVGLKWSLAAEESRCRATLTNAESYGAMKDTGSNADEG